MSERWRDTAVLLGIGCVAAGAAMVAIPAGLIVGGCFLAAVGIGASRDR